MPRNISLSVPTVALDECALRYRRDDNGLAPPNNARVAHVEATFIIPGIGPETITRKVSDIPLSVFNGVTDTNAKQLYNKQTRAILEWLRTEASLDP